MLLYRQLQYSFPVRLLQLHFRSHLVLILLWVFLTMLVTGTAGRVLGMHYLMLTPEYQGEVGTKSFFLTGAAFGVFLMIWHLTTYLLCADRFPFLATLNAPFTKFSLNNSLIPAAFLVVYMSAAIWFQSHDEFTQTWDIVRNIGSFLMGTAFFVLLLAVYLHFTNKDIASFLVPGKFVPRPGGRLLVPGQRIPTIGEIKAGATRWRVDTYLTERCKVRLVRSVAHYDPYLLNRVFRQNHANAIAVQLAALLLLVLHAKLMDVRWAQWPTSVSIFVLASMVMAIFGAIAFWFRKWSPFVFIALLFMVNAITARGYFNYHNHAYGLSYENNQRPKYDYETLERLSSDSILQRDYQDMIGVLDQWKRKQRSTKPTLVLVCVSGGGHKAGLWAIRVMQQLDSLTQGAFLEQTALITGASGGMLGAAYLREVLLLERTGGTASAADPSLFRDAGLDLLNPITSALVSNDLVFPYRRFEYAGQSYRIDRGYYFEQQLNQNLKGRMGRKVADYRAAEQSATIPMLVLSPYIVNDSRRLLISPLGMSFLTRPSESPGSSIRCEVDGVEMMRLLAAQQADSLLFRSALRMNCTFPYILPNTWLPTQPALEIMDAGVRDNFGVTLAVRFAQKFKHWIKANTSGVVVVEISCWNKVEQIESAKQKGMIENALTPAEAATRLSVLQDFTNDEYLSLLDDVLDPTPLQVARLTYHPVKKQRSASLSFHLSKREQIDVYEAIHLENNQKELQALLKKLRH